MFKVLSAHVSTFLSSHSIPLFSSHTGLLRALPNETGLGSLPAPTPEDLCHCSFLGSAKALPQPLLPVKNLPILLGTAQMSPPSQSCPSFSTNPQSVLLVHLLWPLFNKSTVLAGMSHTGHCASCCGGCEDGQTLLWGPLGVPKHVLQCVEMFQQRPDLPALDYQLLEGRQHLCLSHLLGPHRPRQLPVSFGCLEFPDLGMPNEPGFSSFSFSVVEFICF